MAKLMIRSLYLLIFTVLAMPSFAESLRDGYHQKFLNKLSELEQACEKFNLQVWEKDESAISERDELLRKLQSARDEISQGHFFMQPNDTAQLERLQQDVNLFNNFVIDNLEVAALSRRTLGQHKVRLFENYLVAADLLFAGRFELPLPNTNFAISLQTLFNSFLEKSKLDHSELLKLDGEKIENLYQLKSMILYLSAKDKRIRNLYSFGLQASNSSQVDCLVAAIEEKYHNVEVYSSIYFVKSLDHKVLFEKLVKANTQDAYYFGIIKQLKSYDQIRAITTLIEKKRLDHQMVEVALSINTFHKLYSFNGMINNKVEKRVYFQQLTKTENKAQLILLDSLVAVDWSEAKHFELLHRVENEAQAEVTSQLVRNKVSDAALYELALKLKNSVGKRVFLALLKQPQPYELATFALAQDVVFENIAPIVSIIEYNNTRKTQISAQQMAALVQIKNKYGIRSLTFLQPNLQTDLNYLNVLVKVTKDGQMKYLDGLYRANKLGDFSAFEQVLNY